ncbi:MAG TPA: glycosyltransferase family 9 protein [Parafilimonas sp.]
MNWKECKNILCIRADNMGDVIMSTPAFRALKETFGCRLTLLTSKMGSLIAPFIKEIDETIVFDFPWVKTNSLIQSQECLALIEKLKSFQFDAVIIFTVYSQNPLPSALLTYLANIPLRLAYCRENPYELLTDWVPDKEPYSFIQHQVQRDLNLVKAIGAVTNDEHLSVCFNENAFETAVKKLEAIGFNQNKKYVIAHCGVSEIKREYPEAFWINAINILQQQTDLQIVLTGTKNEKPLTQRIQHAIGENVFNAAGILNMEEFIAVIAQAESVISVNTATVHIAAALNKPVIVLYALTNPQHTPWLTKNIVLPFSVPEKLKSKNEVIEFVNQSYFNKHIDYPSPFTVAENTLMLMNETHIQPATQLIVTT